MSDTTRTPVAVSAIQRHAGIAGQFYYSCLLREEGEEPEVATFVGSVYGGPIVWIAPSGYQLVIDRAVTDRIGSRLNSQWIRDFFAPKGGESR